MPDLSAHPSSKIVKALVCGGSGTGKSHLLTTLANAGYRLFILDYDNGLDVVRHKTLPQFHRNVLYHTLTDKLGGPKAVPQGLPQAYTKGIALLDKWEPESYGNPRTWGPDDVLVIDSLTFMGNAIFRYVMSMNNRLGLPKRQADWGEAMEMQEGVLAYLYDESVKCNVVVNAHVTYASNDESGGIVKGYPSGLGTKLPPKIPRYFDHVLGTERQGVGSQVKYKLLTKALGPMDLKSPVPNLANELEPDLAAYFKLASGRAPVLMNPQPPTTQSKV